MMTVKIYPKKDGRFGYGTVESLPHDKNKCIFGITYSEEDAKRRARLYAGDDTVFVGPGDNLPAIPGENC